MRACPIPEHPDPPSFHAQKRRGGAVFLPRDGKMTDALQRLGNIRPDASDLALRQKVMRRPDGGFPKADKRFRHMRRQFFHDIDFHIFPYDLAACRSARRLPAPR